MNTYPVAELTINYDGMSTRLMYTAAQLVIVSDAGYKLWYVEIDGMTQHSLLHMFNQTDQIGVALDGVTADGKHFSGTGFFHPNEQHYAAAIRGDSELPGF